MVSTVTVYLWVLAFISVFVSLFWMIVNSVSKQHKKEIVVLKNFPKVTVAIPVWNEEKSIISTLECILNLDYPLDKLEIIIVDDKSTDNTVGVVKKFISKHKNILLIEHSKNKGKAGAMNTALSKARGDFFWVYDADSYCSKDLLKNLVSRFYEKNNGDVGAVVSITLIKNQGNVVEKMQRLEYVMTAFIRKLTGTVDTLHITNALSLFKTQLIKKLGVFDEGNLTEDFEIAMRLRSRGYRIVMCEKGNFYTRIPSTIKKMWMQRVRWFRGFIYNNLKYRRMILNRDFGLLGLFQIPLEVFVLITLFVSVIILGFNFLEEIINLVFRVYIASNTLFDIAPNSTTQLVLGLNWNFIFPFFIVLSTAFYLYLEAHKYVGEKWKFYIPSILYLFVYPFFRSMQWVHAALLESFGAKKKW